MSALPWLTAAEAIAACTGYKGVMPEITPLTISGSYDPGRATDTILTGTVTITPALAMSPPCQVWVAVRPIPPLANGAAKLNLVPTVDLGNAVSIASNSLLQLTLSPGTPITLTLPILIPAQQKVSQGFYTASVPMLLTSTGFQPLATSTATFSVQVLASCTLPTPTVTTLNFSPGIAGGRVVGGYALSTFINNAGCSGPARLTLRGAPMKTQGGGGAGYDNVINYQATARLAGAAAVLNTTAAAEASVTLPATTGTVSIDVALVDRGALHAAGNYSSVLSVVLEPAN